MISNSCHVSQRAIKMHWRGHDLGCRCTTRPSSVFALLINAVLTGIQSKSSCHYSLQVFVLWNLGPGVCCLSLWHIHAHTHLSTSSKIVLVNEIRLNHALAFHQSLCDGCSPLIHGSYLLQLLPVCADMSNDPLYLTPCWAVDLRDNHRNQGSPPSIITTQNTFLITHRDTKYMHVCTYKYNIYAYQCWFHTTICTSVPTQGVVHQLL